MAPTHPRKRAHSKPKGATAKADHDGKSQEHAVKAGTSAVASGEKSPAPVQRKSRRQEGKASPQKSSVSSPAPHGRLASVRVESDLDAIFGASPASNSSWADLVENSPVTAADKGKSRTVLRASTQAVKTELKVQTNNTGDMNTTPQASPIGQAPEQAVTPEVSQLRRSPRKRMAPQQTPEPSASPSKRARFNSVTGSGGGKRSTPRERKHRKAQPPILENLKPETWEEPKAGWVFDQTIIARRTKELNKGKDTDTYRRYVAEVPRPERQKGVHPRTPNKWIAVSRRSWDTQVRQWRKEIHLWAGDTISNMPSSLNTSFMSEASDEPEAEEVENQSPAVPISDPNDLASLLGHYDLDSRHMYGKTDESTLKAKDAKEAPDAPTDFSVMKSPTKRSMSVI